MNIYIIYEYLYHVEYFIQKYVVLFTNQYKQIIAREIHIWSSVWTSFHFHFDRPDSFCLHVSIETLHRDESNDLGQGQKWTLPFLFVTMLSI